MNKTNLYTVCDMLARERRRELLKSDGSLNVTALAKVSGIPQPTLARILTNMQATPKVEHLKRLAKTLHTDVNVLVSPARHFSMKKVAEAEEAAKNPNIDTSLMEDAAYYYTGVDYGAIPIQHASISLNAGPDGTEIQVVPDFEEPAYFYQRRWITKNRLKPDRLFSAVIRGSSMEPSLYDGDRVLINRDSTEPKNGKVFALTDDTDVLIKRLQIRSGGEWWITSDNPAYSKYDTPLETTQQLIGEAIDKSSSVI